MTTKKRVLITGASRGIGRVTALELAKKGYDLTLVVRDRGRGESVQTEARAHGADVELIVGDLSSMKSVASVASEFLSRHDRLEVLIDNAGAMFTKRQTGVVYVAAALTSAFAVAGTKLPGMQIRNPEVVNKTFPTFWDKLNSL